VDIYRASRFWGGSDEKRLPSLSLGSWEPLLAVVRPNPNSSLGLFGRSPARFRNDTDYGWGEELSHLLNRI